MANPKESLIFPARRNRAKILAVGALRNLFKKKWDLDCEILFLNRLEETLEVIPHFRPHLVLYIADEQHWRLEEYCMTWLAEGFKGETVMLDPSDLVKDSNILLSHQIIDEYLSGPTSVERCHRLIEKKLSKLDSPSVPSARISFELFRNLFDRGLNALFFFNHDLSRCITANLAAEQMTGRSLYELRRMSFKELFRTEDYEKIIGVIRRAQRHYYDARGTMDFLDRFKKNRRVSFSCGTFNFGRAAFFKLEVQDPLEVIRLAEVPEHEPYQSQAVPHFTERSVLKSLHQRLSEASKKHSLISLILCRIKSNRNRHRVTFEDNKLLEKVEALFEAEIGPEDTLMRLSHFQFAILTPRIPISRGKELLQRVSSRVNHLSAFESGSYELQIGLTQCPQDAARFIHLLRSSDATAFVDDSL